MANSNQPLYNYTLSPLPTQLGLEFAPDFDYMDARYQMPMLQHDHGLDTFVGLNFESASPNQSLGSGSPSPQHGHVDLHGYTFAPGPSSAPAGNSAHRSMSPASVSSPGPQRTARRQQRSPQYSPNYPSSRRVRADTPDEDTDYELEQLKKPLPADAPEDLVKERKKRKNTLFARKSRGRKQERLAFLETEVLRLTSERDRLQARNEIVEDMLHTLQAQMNVHSQVGR